MPALDFDSLIAPTAVRDFSRRYWERRPLVVGRHAPDHFGSLLGVGDLRPLLASGRVRFPEAWLVRAGDEVPPGEYVDAEGAIDADHAWNLFGAGATLIFGSLERYWPALWRLCGTIEQALSHPVQANAYLTPPGAQGFAPHFDTHDVFILQLAGAKRWRIYRETIRLPDATHADETRVPRPKRVLHEHVFQPGDSAYIPRGFVHEASTADEPSLHVTLGVASISWADLLAEVLAERRVHDERFRASLPLGFAREATPSSRVRRTFAQLLDCLNDSAVLEDALSSIRARAFARRAPLLD